MRTIALLALLALPACQMAETSTAAHLETVRAGQELEARCQETGDIDDCAAFQAFKADFERNGVAWERAWKG
ncbi:hypothetical protein [Dinoroseobacter sp. S124A]|uniref:hypothetical protein n=1 Tax=Dinoroseobacter sp. S124A TaxID=3415128 RepID=UPI003C7AD5C5